MRIEPDRDHIMYIHGDACTVNIPWKSGLLTRKNNEFPFDFFNRERTTSDAERGVKLTAHERSKRFGEGGVAGTMEGVGGQLICETKLKLRLIDSNTSCQRFLPER